MPDGADAVDVARIAGDATAILSLIGDPAAVVAPTDPADGRADDWRIVTANAAYRQRVGQNLPLAIAMALGRDECRQGPAPFTCRLRLVDTPGLPLVDMRQLDLACGRRLISLSAIADDDDGSGWTRRREDERLIGVGHWEWYPGPDRMIWSDENCRIYGVRPADAPRSVNGFFDRLHPDDRAEILRQYAEDRVAEECEVRATHTDGSTRWLLVRRRAETDREGRVFRRYGITVDITRRKQAELRLAASERRLRAAEALAQIGYFEYILREKRGIWSDNHWQMWGCPPDSFPQAHEESYLRTIHPEDRGIVAEAFAGPVKGREMEFRIIRPDGEVRVIHSRSQVMPGRDGEPLRLFGYRQDVTETRTLERQLRDWERQLRRALKIAGMVSWESNLETGVVIYHGSPEDVIGAFGSIDGKTTFDRFFERIHPDDRANYLASMRDTDADVRRCEYRVLIDGRECHLYVEGVAERDDQGRVVRLVGFTQNIDERKRAEQSLLETRQMIEAAQQVAEVGTWVWDCETGETTWSDTMFRIFGVDRANYRPHATSFLDFIHEGDRDLGIKISVPSQSHRLVQYRIRRPNGEVRYIRSGSVAQFDSRNRPRKTFGIRQDVTDQVNFQRELAEKEALYRDIAECASDWFWETDDAGRIISVSKALTDQAAMEPSAVEGRRWIDLFDERKVDGSRIDVLSSALAEGRQFRDLVFPLRRHDGQPMWVRLSGNPRRLDDGTLIGHRGSGTDVTQLHEANRKLEARQRLEVLGEISGAIAHEINNLLHPMINLSQAAQARIAESDPVAADYLAVVRSSGRRAADVVRDVLAFARPAETEAGIALADAVREAASFAGRAVPERIAFSASIDTALTAPRVTDTKMTQVLANLVNNAVQAIPESGWIAVRLTQDDLAPENGPALLAAAAPHTILSVSDSGTGMDHETSQRIFDPFFTTKGRGQGTGLGLSVVHRIVQGWGATLDVETTPGCGTTIRILFPSCVAGKLAAE